MAALSVGSGEDFGWRLTGQIWGKDQDAPKESRGKRPAQSKLLGVHLRQSRTGPLKQK